MGAESAAQWISMLPRKKKKCKTKDEDRGDRGEVLGREERQDCLSQGLLVSGFRVPDSLCGARPSSSRPSVPGSLVLYSEFPDEASAVAFISCSFSSHTLHNKASIFLLESEN